MVKICFCYARTHHSNLKFYCCIFVFWLTFCSVLQLYLLHCTVVQESKMYEWKKCYCTQYRDFNSFQIIKCTHVHCGVGINQSINLTCYKSCWYAIRLSISTYNYCLVFSVLSLMKPKKKFANFQFFRGFFTN